jgi:D-alanyl-D-alanine carboxypeptidase
VPFALPRHRRFSAAPALLVLALLAVAPPRATAQPATARPAATAATPATDAELAAAVEAMLAPKFAANRPGVVVLVARNGTPIYRKAFGLADVEAKTPLTPESVLRIASITKQFTAVGLLKLVDAGKVRLDDDIRKYLPELPEAAAVTTIEHLLTHTSGIADYTELPEWQSRMREPMTPGQIIDLIKDRPHVVAPGETWKYNNSGYFLLGVVIERVSGQSYADYMQDEVFAPLGMTRTGYGADEPSAPGEARGYALKDGAVVPAPPLSMTHPYASGALVSSVDDMLKWDESFHSGRLLKPDTQKRIFASGVLKNGTATGYGYGFGVSEVEGHRVEQHNGGINGFASQALRMPGQHLYIVLLSNIEQPPVALEFVSEKIAMAAIGRPMPEPGQFTLSTEAMDRFVGVYAIDSTTVRAITREGAKLFSQRGRGQKFEIFPTSDSTCAFVDRPSTLTFHGVAAGPATAVTLQQSGVRETAPRTTREVPKELVAITLSEAKLEAMVGNYELAPGFVLAVTREGAQLFTQATGQPRFEIYPLSETEFFPRVVDARLVFTMGADGKASSVTLHQGGRQIPGRKLPD